MRIGIPKEIKNKEFRVAMTPLAVNHLKALGHEIFVEDDAGVGSGFTNTMYQKAGASIRSKAELFKESDLIVKVKEPLPEEFPLFRKGQLVFTYFHFASSDQLIEGMKDSGAICFAYETLVENGKLPLLSPMSQVAGKLAVQKGTQYLLKQEGGKGLLPSGLDGVDPAKVLVIGGGEVGGAAAELAYGMAMDVTLLDLNENLLKSFKSRFPNMNTLVSSETVLKALLPEMDLIIGAVLVPGAKAPKIVRKEHLKLMQPKTVLVDVAIDQGGCFETSKPTSHDSPVYEVDDIIHYAVTNMPGAVPLSASRALSKATLPFIELLASNDWKELVEQDERFATALNIAEGEIVHAALR